MESLELDDVFRVMDTNKDGALTIWRIYSSCFEIFKIQLTQDDTSFYLLTSFDINKDGRLSYDEFLRCVRGEMNPF